MILLKKSNLIFCQSHVSYLSYVSVATIIDWKKMHLKSKHGETFVKTGIGISIFLNSFIFINKYR